jgi:hypothetical protein
MSGWKKEKMMWRVLKVKTIVDGLSVTKHALYANPVCHFYLFIYA